MDKKHATHQRTIYVSVEDGKDGEQLVTPNGIVFVNSNQVVVRGDHGVTAIDRTEFDDSGFEPVEKEEEETPPRKSPTRKPSAAVKG